jgi:antitoxin component YwqK of YwqJK toxin-antitoxin module
MEYLYSVTCTYDGDRSPHWTGRYDNALDAVDTYNKFVDYGLASEYSTVNLSEPNGKMHTKVFYTNGNIGGK